MLQNFKTHRGYNLETPTQEALTRRVLALVEIALSTRNTAILDELHALVVALLPYLDDAEVDFIGMTEYIDYARQAVEAGEDPAADVDVMRERAFIDASLSRIGRGAVDRAK